VKQYHLKVREQETIESIRYEHERAAGSRGGETATVLALALDGIRYRRMLREQEALQRHQGL
jgi:hypothetical protein